jgi:hypothetical protein
MTHVSCTSVSPRAVAGRLGSPLGQLAVLDVQDAPSKVTIFRL